eukprot:364466-Chlamydomonas_euryale.AAC.7
MHCLGSEAPFSSAPPPRPAHPPANVAPLSTAHIHTSTHLDVLVASVRVAYAARGRARCAHVPAARQQRKSGA